MRSQGPNARQASMLSHLHLLAVVMAGAILFEGVDSCLRNAPPVNQWDGERIYDLRVEADRGDTNTLTAVMSDYIFYCNGTISQWSLQWILRSRSYRYRLGCIITFTFYTLRPEAGNDCLLTLVGSNTMTVRTDEEDFGQRRVKEITLNASIEDGIIVKTGDIVGLRVQYDRNCDYDTLWISGMRYTDNNVYHDRYEEEDDTSSLPNFLGNINICQSRYERDQHSPYMTAVVEPINEATPTTIYPTVTTVTMYQPQVSGSVRMTRRVNFGDGRPAMAGTGDSGGNMVILTSVGASVGVLLVVAAALTALLCVWQCSRRRISPSAPENSPQYAMAENEAYGTHTQHPPQEQVRNGGGVSGVAPEKLQQKTHFLMEENEAYKAHTHDPQGTELNGYYDTVEYIEEEGNDYVVGEPVYYEVPS